MESKAYQFRFEFGLNELPAEPGLIIIPGSRQYGKSTWLDMKLRMTAWLPKIQFVQIPSGTKKFEPGSIGDSHVSF
jgi:hypothetical protein